MLGDFGADILVERGDCFAGEIAIAVEQRKRAFFGRERRRGEIGLALDQPEPFLGRGDRRCRTVAQPAHDQRVGEAGDAEADAALLQRLFLLLRQRKLRDVDDVVHHADAVGDQTAQPIEIDPCLGVNGRSTRLARLIEPKRQAP